MTRNQIEYLKFKESQRSNMRQEELTAARDSVAKELGFGTLAETTRHNQASEAHNVRVLGETQRHNVVQEFHNSQILGEQIRSNVAREELQRAANEETARSNLARERESSRHNKELENQGRIQLGLTEQGLNESRRSNLAREAETYRANLARESEAHRANVASEANRAQQIQLGYDQLDQTRKYQQSSIALGYSQLAENSRANRANEQIRLGELNERQRSNVANEALVKARDRMNFEEQVRANLAREEETRRHNQAVELIDASKQEIAQSRLDEDIRHNKVSEGQSGVSAALKGIETTVRYVLPIIMG